MYYLSKIQLLIKSLVLSPAHKRQSMEYTQFGFIFEIVITNFIY